MAKAEPFQNADLCRDFLKQGIKMGADKRATFKAFFEMLQTEMNTLKPAHPYGSPYFPGQSHRRQQSHAGHPRKIKQLDGSEAHQSKQGKAYGGTMLRTECRKHDDRRSIYESRFDATHSPFLSISLPRLQLRWQLRKAVSCMCVHSPHGPCRCA